MPIGSPLTNSVATVGASGTAYATTTNALLNELKTAVEGTVPFSALSGSTLDLNNVPVIDASYVAFYDASVTPSAAITGRLVYALGEFWAVNSTGAVQLTSGSGLNAASIGGIAGDYGSPNPASVRFVDAATRYDFYDDYSTLTWAFNRARGFDIAAGAISSFYCQMRYGGALTYTYTLPPTLPTTGRTLLTIDNTGNTLVNDVSNTVQSTSYFAGDIQLTGTAVVKHPVKYIEFFPEKSVAYLVAGTFNANSPLPIASGGSTTFRIALPPLERGSQITEINMRGFKSTGGNATFDLSTVTIGASGVETETAIGTTATTNTVGVFTLTKAYTKTVAQYESYRLTITLPANTDSCWCIEIGYNRV